jgi:hypothetical protein
MAFWGLFKNWRWEKQAAKKDPKSFCSPKFKIPELFSNFKQVALTIQPFCERNGENPKFPWNPLGTLCHSP